MSGPMSLYPESCRQPTHRRAPRAHRSQGALIVVAIRGRNCVPPSTLCFAVCDKQHISSFLATG